MAKPLISVDLSRPAHEQDGLHNRWHPEIPPAATVRPGDIFRLEMKDWTDGQIGDNDSADDVRDVDLSVVHILTGPVHVDGAEPGDLLVVDLLDLGPLDRDAWGFTGIFARENGGGFLTDVFPEARKACWDFEGIFARSRHLPGVRFPGIVHPGLIGTAPSAELLATWNRREAALVATDPDRVPTLANLPTATNATLGALRGAQFDRVAAEGARTVPPREHGGNCDIKNLSRGSRIFFPVYVDGARLSMGDMHFSQGDGEITFCGAIEMSGFADLHVDLIKGGMAKYGLTSPLFKPGPVEPRFENYLVFEGISVDERTGEQRFVDATLAYRRACLAAIDYLANFGYSREQALLILGTAPIEGRISGIVDVPNACCTLYLPTSIFDGDIVPSSGPIPTIGGGSAALPSS
ncbi:formamidase [Actinocrispum wychmicini]|uniref:Formamidase n=1 Tax=Actinocrispum wychmicini TaxID=1213861 RepID=A0A4R2JHV1_9PSEU|nr:formamidase [Actinocrispum wychmicini]TCO55979.1 formamidase [Actinocrispum wychmicini]